MKKNLISVVIPCYNHGAFIDDAISSLELETYGDVFELIVVDDGSTDALTKEKLASLEASGVKVIRQPNSGLAAARNAGIAASTGEFILPLDSDNKIIPSVFVKAMNILASNGEYQVVYTDAYRFGDDSTPWKVGQFDFARMLNENFIDACSLIRRSAFDNWGGYDGAMPTMGYEDWELWVKFYLSGAKFWYLEEKGFYYRVRSSSMLRTITFSKSQATRHYIFDKHKSHVAQIADVYHQIYTHYAGLKKMEQYMKRFRFRSIIKMIINRPFYVKS